MWNAVRCGCASGRRVYGWAVDMHHVDSSIRIFLASIERLSCIKYRLPAIEGRKLINEIHHETFPDYFFLAQHSPGEFRGQRLPYFLPGVSSPASMTPQRNRQSLILFISLQMTWATATWAVMDKQNSKLRTLTGSRPKENGLRTSMLAARYAPLRARC